MISMRRLGLILAIAVTTITVGATPVQAAGGGCVDSTQNGWTISVCSSDDGTIMRTDYYVNARPSFNECRIDSFIVWDGLPDLVLASSREGCGLGRHGGPSIDMRNYDPKRFRHVVRVSMNTYPGGYVYQAFYKVGPLTYV